MIRAVIIYGLIFATITAINMQLVTKQTNSYSWQYVKIFDLTAISIAKDKPLYPTFMMQQKQFSFARVKQLFIHQRVDEIVFRDNSPVVRCKNDNERHQLWVYWFKTILKHPINYMKHRLHVLGVTVSEYQYVSMLTDTSKPSETKWKRVILENKVFKMMQSILQELTLFKWYLPISIFYLLLGLAVWSRHQAAKPLVFMNATGLMMVVLLLFLSMAGVHRYIFISVVMFHFSHPFAYMCFKSRKLSVQN